MGFTKHKRTVLVHHKTGVTLEGILLGRSRGHYILRVAKLKKDEEQTYSLDGEIRVPRENVEFFQVLD